MHRIAADVVVVVHFSYVAFIVVGLLAILVGALLGWRWIRNVWFRALHLLAIGVVVVESLLGVECPLTTLERSLQIRAGSATYHGDFLATFVHNTLFCEAETWVFTLVYSLFGLLVVITFIWVPPRRRNASAVHKEPMIR